MNQINNIKENLSCSHLCSVYRKKMAILLVASKTVKVTVFLTRKL